ncbi:glycosyltransferase [Siculibacillus lacustris]|uniref:Glycosyltransferase n=1 Tax=Siculibacillus lacustris TaxID=1549641 RepID=A0A4Q9VE43_9HYPH|nr:glycosyltransferase family 2 protein [Siculibacillus lacustris]TBW33019.1 glycosyltransferase [Siculibacillus lacustris]
MTASPVEATPPNGHGRRVSVVLPMRNESKGLDRLFARLVPALDALGVAFEIVTVDDGSTDETLEWLKARRAILPALKIVSLSRNFGKEIAVTAGLARTTGDVMVVMDSDLQHPPESIAALIAPWRSGAFDLVYARRVNLDRGGFLRNAFSKGFYRAFDMMSEVKVDRETGDFIAADRKVVDAFLAMPERNRFNRGLFSWAGFRTTTVAVTMEERVAGTSQWGFIKLLRLAVNAITSFGTLPLKVWAFIGSAVSLSSLLYGAYVVIKTLLFGADVPGYPSLLVAILFFAGIQLIGLGIIGEYLGHVFSEVKRRPLYFVQEAIGFERPLEERAATSALVVEELGTDVV